ncbi:MAG: tyrosine-protein phosphatase [Rhodobacteraceae bacterium]|nr:tyrosine-protein phosphatase [Paracoccaceae bacterium]
MSDLVDQPVPGTLNFRAVVPVALRDGGLRRGALWRSGAFDGIGAEGLQGLRARRVTTVFDLRADIEKARRPSPLLAQPGFTVATFPHDFRSGDLVEVMRRPGAVAEDAAAVMMAIYRRLLREFRGVYALCLRTVIANETPVAIHCTAGKDRTGIAVALILDLLGASRDDIVADYLRTNAASDLLRAKILHRDQGSDYGPVPAGLVEPVITADPRYLAAMFETLESDFGGSHAYASRVLGLSGAELDALARRLLA